MKWHSISTTRKSNPCAQKKLNNRKQIPSVCMCVFPFPLPPSFPLFFFFSFSVSFFSAKFQKVFLKAEKEITQPATSQRWKVVKLQLKLPGRQNNWVFRHGPGQGSPGYWEQEVDLSPLRDSYCPRDLKDHWGGCHQCSSLCRFRQLCCTGYKFATDMWLHGGSWHWDPKELIGPSEQLGGCKYFLRFRNATGVCWQTTPSEWYGVRPKRIKTWSGSTYSQWGTHLFVPYPSRPQNTPCTNRIPVAYLGVYAGKHTAEVSVIQEE